jgi:hypothetical protein
MSCEANCRTYEAALAQVHGADTIEREFSDYYLAAELDAVSAGTGVRQFRVYSPEAYFV